MCCDLAGGLYEGFDGIELRGMLVGGAVEGGWVGGYPRVCEAVGVSVGGVWELMGSTNAWRARRGHEEFVVEV